MIIVQLKAPVKQKDWLWPAVANFVLGGMGAGFYLVCFLLYLSSDAMKVFFDDRFSFGFISVAFVVSGYLCLGVKTERPLRGLYLFRRLRQSWISRETAFGCIFVITALADCIFSNPILKMIAGISALGFLISQGYIVFKARAIVAWNVPIIPLAFLSSGLVAGYGLFLLLITPNAVVLKQTLFTSGFIFLMLNLIIWFVYLKKLPAVDSYNATKMLRQPLILTLMIGVSQIIPLLLLLFLLIQNQKMSVQPWFLTLINALCGVLLLIGNIGQKAAIIIIAGLFRAIELRG